MQIELENVSFSYGVVPTLHDVSFSVRQGALVAVLGPNGAGKSTLFRCILRLLKPSAGTIRLCGEDTAAIDRRRLAKLAAYIPQSSTPVSGSVSGEIARKSRVIPTPSRFRKASF